MRKPMALLAGALAAVLVAGGAFTVRGEASIKGEIVIQLDPAGSSASGAGVDIDGGEIAIHSAGVYRVRGTLADGQIRVKVGKEDDVTLILDGADISNPDEAAIYVENAGLTTIRLAEGSENRVCSGEPVELSADAADESAKGGAIHAKDDLVIDGPGALTVLGYVNNGIHCSNRLTIQGGAIEVEAVNNGVKGKDGVTVSGGELRVRSGGDGIDSDAEDGEGYGVIDITGGEIFIESFGDGAQAATVLTVSDGSVSVISGGGSAAAAPKQDEEPWGRWNRGENWDRDGELDGTSTKGLKAGTLLVISGGEINVDAADDALHSNGEVSITGGTLALATGDDGVHADDSLTVSDGTLTITASYEGIEANQILIAGGAIDVTADDDGLNANGGQDVMMGFGGRGGFGGQGDSDMRANFGGRGGFGERGSFDESGSFGKRGDFDAAEGFDGGGNFGGFGRPGGFDRGGDFDPPDGLPGDFPGDLPEGDFAGAWGGLQAEAEESGALPTLRITGGVLHVNAEGDGLDSNGDLIVEGGEIVVDGPSRGGNGALDSGSESGGVCVVNGGTVLAIGSSSMAETFDGDSEQCSFLYNFSGELPAGTEITVADAEGNVLCNHTSAKSFSSVVFSCPELVLGQTYVLTAGDETVEIELDSTSTTSGERARWGR